LFTKDDLKTGDILELRDGRKGLVLRDTGERGDVISGPGYYCPLENITEDFKHQVFPRDGNEIVRVYRPWFNCAFHKLSVSDSKLIWERKDVKRVTLGEAVEILRQHYRTHNVVIEVDIKDGQ
jgi:hypothetical protein